MSHSARGKLKEFDREDEFGLQTEQWSFILWRLVYNEYLIHFHREKQTTTLPFLIAINFLGTFSKPLFSKVHTDPNIGVFLKSEKQLRP